ncbi:MAG: glycosyltransferase [Acidobacteriota bacterium]
MNRDKPAVAHLHSCFFAKSETFIFNTIAGLRRFRPICLAWEFRNLDLFPLPARTCFPLGSPRYSPSWWPEALARRLADRELGGERVLRREGAVLLHAHFGPSGVLALRLQRGTGLPLVTTFYGHDMSQLGQDPRWQERYQRLFVRGELFLVEGPHMKEQLAGLGCPAEKIAIQRIAIPVSRLAFRARSPRGRGENVVLLFAGRFTAKKGLGDALSALAQVRERFPRVELRVIGDGALRGDIERQIISSKMKRIVQLLGFLDHREYLAEMERADIFLQPSATAADGDSEGGAPTTILEAQALGLPVVATRHADIPNVVAPGESALLGPEHDVDALADNILVLLQHQESWAAMGRAGRRFVETHHDVASEIPRLEARYAELAR